MFEALPEQLNEFIRDHYQSSGVIPLHEPRFGKREQEFVQDTIASTFVSSVGQYVDRFEQDVAKRLEIAGCVATTNGSSALYTSLYFAGVGQGDLVITQPLSFVATANCIRQLGASPVFVDIDPATLSLSPNALCQFLKRHCELQKGQCVYRDSGQIVRCVLPMNSFGHPAKLDQIQALAKQYNLPMVVDAAQSFGSQFLGKNVEHYGDYNSLSFNGNKIITTGGGGMVATNRKNDLRRLKHVTTTAKVRHPYEFCHDEVGFNFRMPNINAALGCAQLAIFDKILESKRDLAARYQAFFANIDGYEFVTEPENCQSNYWLNTIICPSQEATKHLLDNCNNASILARPAWRLLPDLPMYQDSISDGLDCARHFQPLIVNLPSSAVLQGASY